MDKIEPVDVLEAVHTVMHAFRARQHAAQDGAPHGLTLMDGKVLGFFARHPGAAQSELVAHSGRDKGQIARLIAGLRERELLEADTSAEGDRRSVRLKLTAKGRSAHQAQHKRRQQLAADACSELSAAEQQQLVALLGKLGRQLAP